MGNALCAILFMRFCCRHSCCAQTLKRHIKILGYQLWIQVPHHKIQKQVLAVVLAHHHFPHLFQLRNITVVHVKKVPRNKSDSCQAEMIIVPFRVQLDLVDVWKRLRLGVEHEWTCVKWSQRTDLSVGRLLPRTECWLECLARNIKVIIHGKKYFLTGPCRNYVLKVEAVFDRLHKIDIFLPLV